MSRSWCYGSSVAQSNDIYLGIVRYCYSVDEMEERDGEIDLDEEREKERWRKRDDEIKSEVDR